MFLNRRSCFVLVCVAAFCGSAQAESDQIIALAADGTVTLAHAGKARFANFVLPDQALAQAWFAQHLLQHDVAFTRGEDDRYGRVRLVADAQVGMLRDGIAVIFAQEDVPASWSAAEADARRAKRGVWGVDGFLLTPEQTPKHLGEFHVVEGPITRIFDARTATYLNFGEHWQTDFSVTIAGRPRKQFKDILATLHEGSRVRVRGTLYEENGPMLKLSHPAQLELL